MEAPSCFAATPCRARSACSRLVGRFTRSNSSNGSRRMQARASSTRKLIRKPSAASPISVGGGKVRTTRPKSYGSNRSLGGKRKSSRGSKASMSNDEGPSAVGGNGGGRKSGSRGTGGRRDGDIRLGLGTSGRPRSSAAYAAGMQGAGRMRPRSVPDRSRSTSDAVKTIAERRYLLGPGQGGDRSPERAYSCSFNAAGRDVGALRERAQMALGEYEISRRVSDEVDEEERHYVNPMMQVEFC